MFLGQGKEIHAFGKYSVLLLEDDAMTSEITAMMLQYLGYTVEAVTKGEDSVVLYRRRKEEGLPFDAVILDICQPEGIGGEETLRQLREYDPDVRVIASSGFTGHKIMIDHRSYGFRASLPKPYGIRQLGTILRDVIEAEAKRKDLKWG